MNSFADRSLPSKDDVVNECKQFQNSLNEFEFIITDIEDKEIEFLKNKNIEYDYNELRSDNKNFIDSLSAVLSVIPNFYAKDTTDNLALVVFKTIQKSYQSYVDAVYKKNKIFIREDFWVVLKSSISSFHQQYTRLTPSQKIAEGIAEGNNHESQSSDASEQDSPKTKIIEILVYIALALSALSIIISVIIFLTLKKLSDRLDRHRDAIDNVNTKVDDIKDSQKHDGSNRYRSNNYTPSSPTLSSTQIDKLKEEILSSCLAKISSIYKVNSLPEITSNASTNISASPIPVPSIPVPSMNQPKKEKIEVKKQEYIMYAELRTNGTFKVAESDNGNAFFIIKLNDPNAKTGTFELKSLSKESVSAAIENRQLILMPACDLTSIGQNNLKTDQPGIAEKVGNEWKVIAKAKVTIC